MVSIEMSLSPRCIVVHFLYRVDQFIDGSAKNSRSVYH
jgi:hypothetical protein